MSWLFSTDRLFSEWKVWSQFLDQITYGLKLDGLAKSHPIEVEINHVGEIDEIFDAGYAVLYRMNETGINPDVISYNSLISSAARKCLLSKHLNLFDEMLQRGIHPDVWSYNILKLPPGIEIALRYCILFVY
ncbi:putative membrane alanyl aminopeptidase [Lupinus albus]|uniref:Putative membrane alanyl aminopeptidase n=1 Tax=Lupinus albus TaxID=3870 RepID=A0A6A4NYB8_LUPAL|nr:putative membrane alanyl aminopeptidase [Lupinus albus]